MNALVTAILSLSLFAGAADKPKTPDDPLASTRKWSRKHAAHLLRRAGFGGTPEQITYLTSLGREGAVSYLVDYERIEGDLPVPNVEGYEPRRPRELLAMDKKERQKVIAQRRRDDRFVFEQVVSWWVEVMVSTPRPLEEKLVLFWHGHFTSGYREVKSAHAMLGQNELLRRHASGNFRDLLLYITEDPAMVLYLNTQQNRKNSPNENYARELLELFTMGTGNYSEKDIKEAARAFTGISVDQQTGEAIYRANQHDFGVKTFLGKTGDLQPADIIDAILEQPVTAEYIARKFWSYFAYADPDDAIIKALGGVLRNNKYELKPMLRAMFMSEAFYAKRAMLTNIKSPVELVVGTMRSLEIPPVDTANINIGMRLMGQSLMQPPNVKGWDGGETWITASTLFNRYNVLGALIAGNDNEQGRRRRQRVIEAIRNSTGKEGQAAEEALSRLQPPYDPTEAMRKYRLVTAEKTVDHYVQRLLQRPLKPERKKVLLDALKPRFRAGDIESSQNVELIRGLIHLIVSMPEYQLS